jgi:hypothetical protein
LIERNERKTASPLLFFLFCFSFVALNQSAVEL